MRINMETYIENAIKTALANGLTMEQIAANPDAVLRAYCESQLCAIDNAGAQALADFTA